MDTILNIPTMALTPLLNLCGKIGAFLPAVISALVLLFVGGLLAYWTRNIAGQLMKTIQIDDFARRIGVSDILNRLGLGPSLARLVEMALYATIVLASVLGAAEAVGLPIVSEYLHRVVMFGPKLIGVTVVMAGGLFLGDVAGSIVHRAAEANHIKGSTVLMRVTHGLMVLFSGTIALEILGIPLSIFFDSMQIVLAAVGLGCAIAFGVAFGMAGRDTAEKWIKDLTPKPSRSMMEDHEPRMRVVK